MCAAQSTNKNPCFKSEIRNAISQPWPSCRSQSLHGAKLALEDQGPNCSKYWMGLGTDENSSNNIQRYTTDLSIAASNRRLERLALSCW
ncbi:hypothetical protein I7I50_05184 [Histoplasma capsulatum G186AR]|uniref:Uncharacterized protein n=1 Tax=Ajellomyces capsulatus TaxID=5037 RepID=A0A8H8D8R2_AJECA|nr:hypothetical protein I7I52_03442 [Histoplasma capsulatum]QSS75896.1 hypothetical protein I7I50_05184 [Histoplasma capsulatum G186AR]